MHTAAEVTREEINVAIDYLWVDVNEPRPEILIDAERDVRLGCLSRDNYRTIATA